MRVHFILNHTEGQQRLADVEIHFEEGLLRGLKLVGFSVWKSKKKDGQPSVVVPSRSYSTAAGLRYYELLRPSDDAAPDALKELKAYIREEYIRVAGHSTEKGAAE